MKRACCFLFPLTPTLIGYIYNLILIPLLSVPFLFSLVFYVLPFAMLFYWFWAGRKYAQAKGSALISILIGNSIGILSLLLYIWQFVLLSDQQRNLFLAGLSQYFSSPIVFLTMKVAVLFESQKYAIGSTTAVATQIIGLFVMLVVFAVGIFYEKRKTRI